MRTAAQALIDPRMLGSLNRFFPSTCDIATNRIDPDSMGSPVNTREQILSNVPCAIAPIHNIIPISGERRNPEYTYDVATYHITLQGYYLQIDVHMVAHFNDIDYDIVGVERDSQSKMTRLIVKDFTT
jgi:hypothetical protein